MWLASSMATVRTIRRSVIEQIDEAFVKDCTRLRLQHMGHGDPGEKLAAAGVDQREFFGESCMACDQGYERKSWVCSHDVRTPLKLPASCSEPQFFLEARASSLL